MPELPEVETVRRGLDDLIIDKVVAQVSFTHAKQFPNDPQAVKNFLIGARVRATGRRGKVLFIHLDNDYSLVIHLKMTGQLVYIDDSARWGGGHPSDSLVQSLPDKSTHVTITFRDGSRLYYNDQRRFGWIKLYSDPEIQSIPLIAGMGPEPLSKLTTAEDVMQRIRRKKNSGIKATLLDQSVIAGIGNIYADESLWAAGIHPERRVFTLKDAELKTLHKEIVQVLRLSLDKGGSTDKNYVNARGQRGSYIDFARVFRREGAPCKRCKNEIIKIRVAGRGTHICAVCQPMSGTKRVRKGRG